MGKDKENLKITKKFILVTSNQKSVNNYAFIDGQNLYAGTKEGQNSWVDFRKFRIYLKEKYKVEKAYYFLGYKTNKPDSLFQQLQEKGYIVILREHSELLASKKKGNIDTDLVFEVMKKLIEEPEKFSKIVIISGDGDFKKLVDYLIKKDKFQKILFPHKKFSSSLYRRLNNNYYFSLESIRSNIGR